MARPVYFAGGEHRGRSAVGAGSSLLNLYLQQTPTGAEAPGVLIGTPGTTLFASLDDTSVLGMHFWKGRVYAVTRTGLWRIDGPSSAVLIGSLAMSGPVRMADNGEVLVFVDGARGYTYDGTTLAEIRQSGFYPSEHVVFLDGYLILNRSGTGQFFYAGPYSTTFDALDFATAEARPDPLLAVLADHRELWMFGSETVEVWYNAGGADLPFERIGGAVIEHGIASPWCAAKANNTVFWLSNDGFVFSAPGGYQPVRISTHEVEHDLAARNTGLAEAFTYYDEGHTFYVLTVGERTWVYDAATEQWHRRAHIDHGRHHASCYVRAFNRHLIGDFSTGKVWEWSLAVNRDGARPLISQATSAPIHDSRNRVSHRSFEARIDAGMAPLIRATGEQVCTVNPAGPDFSTYVLLAMLPRTTGTQADVSSGSDAFTGVGTGGSILDAALDSVVRTAQDFVNEGAGGLLFHLVAYGATTTTASAPVIVSATAIATAAAAGRLVEDVWGTTFQGSDGDEADVGIALDAARAYFAALDRGNNFLLLFSETDGTIYRRFPPPAAVSWQIKDTTGGTDDRSQWAEVEMHVTVGGADVSGDGVPFSTEAMSRLPANAFDGNAATLARATIAAGLSDIGVTFSEATSIMEVSITAPEAETINPAVGLLIEGDFADGSATFTDLSTNAHTVTRSGAGVEWSTDVGIIGASAMSFAGTHYLSIANDPSLQLGAGPFHIKARINPTAHADVGGVCIVGQLSSELNGRGWQLNLGQDGTLKFEHFIAGGFSPTAYSHFSAGAAITFGTEYAIDLICDASGSLTLYIDGVQSGTVGTIAGSIYATDVDVRVGGAGNTDAWYIGAINQVVISKAILPIYDGVPSFYATEWEVDPADTSTAFQIRSSDDATPDVSTTWDVIWTVTGEAPWTSGETRTFAIPPVATVPTDEFTDMTDGYLGVYARFRWHEGVAGSLATADTLDSEGDASKAGSPQAASLRALLAPLSADGELVCTDVFAANTDPQIVLDWSDDEGRTWGTQHRRSMGAEGRFGTRAVWHRLGRARTRTYRVTISDDVPRRLLAAGYLEVTP